MATELSEERSGLFFGGDERPAACTTLVCPEECAESAALEDSAGIFGILRELIEDGSGLFFGDSDDEFVCTALAFPGGSLESSTCGFCRDVGFATKPNEDRAGVNFGASEGVFACPTFVFAAGSAVCTA